MRLSISFSLLVLSWFCNGPLSAQTPVRRPAAAKPAPPKPAASAVPDPAPTKSASLTKGITRADLVKKADALLKSNKLAVVVSVSDYEIAEPGLSNLIYTKKDMLTVKQALEAQGYNVLQLQDGKATATNIRDSLRGLASLVDKPEESTVVFYFSGHGFATGDDNYLVTYGSTIADLAKQGLAMKEVKALLEQSGAAQRMAFVDACRNDPNQKSTGVKRSIASFTSQSGTKVLFSTAPGQVSYEDPALEQGRFTHFLVRGIRGEAAKQDEFISWDDLKNYMVDNMRKYSMKDLTKAQIPWTDDNSSGDFLIGKKLAEAAPPPVIVAEERAGPTPSPSVPVTPPADHPLRVIERSSTMAGSEETWGSVMHGSRRFSFKFDPEAIYLFAGTHPIGSLEAKKNKRSGVTERYEGKVSIAPADRCPGGQGKAIIEAKNISENRIKIRIEEPGKDGQCNTFSVGIFGKMIGPETVFVKGQ